MALVWNQQTGRMEDDGIPLVRPLTGTAIDTAPDVVNPADLIVGADPRHPYGKPMLGTSMPVSANPAPTPPGQGSTPMLPLPGRPVSVTADQALDIAGAGASRGLRGVPLPGGPAEPAEQSVTVPAKPRAAGGGGGGGGSSLPTGPTAGQTLAHGQQLTAQDQERDVIEAGTQLEQRKAGAMVTQDQTEAQAEKELLQKQKTVADQLIADHKAKQDTLANDKIHDMFEGRPLAAIIAAISSGLGAFAAIRSGGPNHAQGVLDRAADMFRQKELHRFEQEEKAAGSSQQALERAEVRADVSTAALYKKFARDREVVLRRFGADDARVAGDSLMQKSLAKAAEHEEAWQDKTYGIARQAVLDRAAVNAQNASANHSNAEAAKTRAETDAIQAGGGRTGKPAVEAVAQVAGLDSGLAAIDRAISQIEKSPKAAQEFLSNNEAWTRAEKASEQSGAVRNIRGGLQAIGAANVAPEEGLKTPGAKEIHKGVQSILTATAKAFGGVITQSDIARAASQVSAVGSDPKAFVSTLRQIREEWASKRQLFMQNAGVTLTAGSPSASAPTSAALPPGAIRSTYKGIRGYRIGKAFYPGNE